MDTGDKIGIEQTMEPDNIWFDTPIGDSVSVMTSLLSGNTLTTGTNTNTATTTMTTATTTHQDHQTPIRDNETTATNITTPSTRRKKEARRSRPLFIAVCQPYQHPQVSNHTTVSISL
jgi:hypothetical protein